MPLDPFPAQPSPDARHFTGRREEAARIRNALLSPRARLLVHGPRRIGKSWTVETARREAEDRGGVVTVADLSGSSAVADLANRLLAAAGRSLGESWTDAVGELVSRVGLPVRLDPDPATGDPVPSLEPTLRNRPTEDQWTAFRKVLETLDLMAARGDRILGIVLDEFQVVRRFGGEEAEGHLRASIQGHEDVSFVLVGSGSARIREMLREGRPFHRFFGTLAMASPDPGELAAWIEEGMIQEGMATAGRTRPGLGARCVEVAGPRIGDVAQLARACLRVPGEEPVDAAFRRILRELDASLRSLWRDLTPYQQNVLRAVAGAERGLTTADTLERFGLGHSGSASNAAQSLVQDDLLVRADGGSGYDFDSPFLRGWVVAHALPDVGLRRRASWRPGR